MLYRSAAILWIGLALSPACSGTIGNAPNSGAPDAEGLPPDNLTPDEFEALPLDPGEREQCAEIFEKNLFTPLQPSIRRLAWSEINHALIDLFPGVVPSSIAEHLEADGAPGRMPHQLDASETFVRTYRPALATHTAKVAAAVANTECPDGAAACVQSAVLKVARRAWRGEVGETELAFLNNAVAKFHAELGAVNAYGAALELVLASPRFLYLLDVGSLEGDTDVERARGFRLAGLLAASLWSSIPDDELLTEAGNQGLDDTDGIRRTVERMLADPRARRGMAAFYRSWLGHNRVLNATKDEKLFAGLNDRIRQEMLEDTESTLLEQLFDHNADTAEMLTSPRGNVSAALASLMGWEGAAGKGVDLSRFGRHGVATHPAVLAVTSGANDTSIVNRGEFFVEQLACGHIPDPPPGVDSNVDDIVAAATRPLSNREISELHMEDPSCASCHQYLDPFGIAFENYDAIGRMRNENRGVAINTQFTVEVDFVGLQGSYSGAVPLLDKLAETGVTQRCFVKQLANFVKPAEEFTTDQTCRIAALVRNDNGEAPSMREMVTRFVTSELFLARAATNPTGENK